jgi:polyhydroxyalkanoate synthesis regulator phasin
MDQTQVFKQMIDFNKNAFENSFNAMVMVQNQTEKMVNDLLDQNPWLPEQGRKAINEWVKGYKKGRDDFKKAVDENFKRVESFFAKTEKPAKAKTEKASKA